MSKVASVAPVVLDNSNLTAGIVLGITTAYNNAIAQAEKNLQKAILAFPGKLAECLLIKSLELDGMKSKEFNDARIIDLCSSLYFSRREVYCTIEDLRKLRKEFGEFTLNDDCKDIHDAEKGTVEIPITFDRIFQLFRFMVIREIPADAKCKIVKTTRVVEDTSLVCGMPLDNAVECLDELC